MQMILAALAGALLATDTPITAAPAVQSAPMLSYGTTRNADAMVLIAPYRFSVYVHPEHQLLLIQPKIFGNPPRPDQWPISLWRQTAEQFVRPLGCGVPTVQVKSRMGATWEATFLCPDGVDLRAVVMSQRKSLQTGAPIVPPSPSAAAPTE